MSGNLLSIGPIDSQGMRRIFYGGTEDYWSESFPDNDPCVFNPDQVSLYFDESQQDGQSMSGDDLLIALRGLPVMGVAERDAYLANPDTIPAYWEGLQVFFWRLILVSRGGTLRIPFLYKQGDVWKGGTRWIESTWRDIGPAAIHAEYA